MVAEEEGKEEGAGEESKTELILLVKENEHDLEVVKDSQSHQIYLTQGWVEEDSEEGAKVENRKPKLEPVAAGEGEEK